MKKSREQIRFKTFGPYLKAGSIVAAIIAIAEYFIRIDSQEPQDFIPLFIRTQVMAFLILSCVILFEIYFKKIFIQKTFLFPVVVRSIAFTIIASFWLSAINGIWIGYRYEMTFVDGLLTYWSGFVYLINLVSVFGALIIGTGVAQINLLFRKGELINFIIGKYNRPKEIDRVFCFIDLKGSTTIGEKLGHYKYGMFLKDYYSDITAALRETKAEIYQYVGDEIVLNWTYRNAFANNNMLNCFYRMKDIIKELEPKYKRNYGFIPKFKAGMHGGKVMVTWVGEIKKEIVYIGDVLNTTSRIQEDCKRLNKEFLVSGELVSKIENLNGYKASFLEETVPRGKEKTVKLFDIRRKSESLLEI